MTIPPRTKIPDYFVAGGTLSLKIPSYVKREADDKLFDLVLNGQFSYVLNTRQIGKSSLMTRTGNKLQKDGVCTATIDLTSLGMAVEERWYLGLLGELTRQLHLEIDPEAWWQERSWQPTVQRFIGFLRDVVLSEIQEQVVIFIDEIDSTLRLHFSDDFFAAIRAVYNVRAQEPIFERLTFVLLGVASPPDLIQDRTRTPFNIGQGILLQDFSLDDATVLQTGLEKKYPDQSGAIFRRIYHWTDGHPYLTQKLCKEMVKSEEERWTNEQIDELVERTFLSDKGLKEENLQFVRNKILTHAKQRELLGLYRKVYEGQKVADNAQSPLQTQLKLSGLVKTENGHLSVRNEIYRRTFDLAWVRQNTAIDWVRFVAFPAVFLVILFFGMLAQSTLAGIKEQEIRAKFYERYITPIEPVALLAELFQLQAFVPPADYDYKAKELFYSLSRDEQLALFESYSGEEADLILVVKGLYITLADVDQSDSTRELLEVMLEALNHFRPPQTTDLQNEIKSWLKGRESYGQDKYTEAHVHYNDALNLNGDNPATLYERARVLTELSRYKEALVDLESIVVIAKRTSVPTTSKTAPPSFTPTSTATPSITLTPKISSSSTLPSGTMTTPSAQTPTDSSSATTPDGAVTATPLLTLVTTPTPLPTTSPVLSSFTSEFDTPEKMIGAVRNFIKNNPELVNALTNTSTSQYTNLLGVVPLPTVSSIATPEEAIVNGEGISITSVRPSYGWNDELSVVYIQGNGFAEPLTVTLNDEPLEIESLTPEIIRAIVPAGLSPGSYNVKLKIAGEQASHLNATYDVLWPPDKDDLVSYPEWLWTDIAPLRVGYANSVGLNLQRLGGRRMLDGVTVEFELNAFEGRVVLGRSITHPLSPNRVEATAKVTWEPQEAGKHTICAIIDPDNEVLETSDESDSEGNNTICRTVMVLEEFSTTKSKGIISSHSLISGSLGSSVLGLEEGRGERAPNKPLKEFSITVLDDDPDAVAPVVHDFVIENGDPTTAERTVRLDVTATDLPLSSTNGVQALKFVEYEYSFGAQRWVPVQQSDWGDYNAAQARYSWTLIPTYGIRYIRAWALDKAGNISFDSGIDIVNLLPSEQEGFVAQDEIVFYRMYLEEGDTFVGTLTPISGDPDLYVWGQSDESPWSSNNATGIDSVEFEALETGTYQIEVHGSTDAKYRLTFGVK